MNKFKLFVNIFVLLGMLALVIIHLMQNKQAAENRIYHYDKEKPIPVFGAVLSDQSGMREKSFSGTFEAMNEVKINAETQGKIIAVYVKEGQRVVKGQALAKIDDRMLQLQMNVMETKLTALKKDEKRYIHLTDDDAVPGVSLEKIQNSIATLEAEKKSLLEQIHKCTVSAPFEGIITLKLCETGAFASPAIPLFELVNLSALKFVVHVAEHDLGTFSAEQHYSITCGAENREISAALLQVSNKGGIGNSFKVEFSVESKADIRPKMLGELHFEYRAPKTKNLTIPAHAILGSESNPEIYCLQNGKAKRTPVHITGRNGDEISITGEISAGDTVITGGFINVFDNARVVVKL
jgi:RND family efflux transporter MFP subunit